MSHEINCNSRAFSFKIQAPSRYEWSYTPFKFISNLFSLSFAQQARISTKKAARTRSFSTHPAPLSSPRMKYFPNEIPLVKIRFQTLQWGKKNTPRATTKRHVSHTRRQKIARANEIRHSSSAASEENPRCWMRTANISALKRSHSHSSLCPTFFSYSRRAQGAYIILHNVRNRRAARASILYPRLIKSTLETMKTARGARRVSIENIPRRRGVKSPNYKTRDFPAAGGIRLIISAATKARARAKI